MNNVIMRSVALSGEYQPLSATSLIGSVTVAAPSTNAAACQFRGDDGTDVAWPPGSRFELQRVDLATIEVKGQAGDTVLIVGGTW